MAEVQEVRIRMAVDTKGLDTATAKTKLLEKEIELSEKKTKQLTADFDQLQAELHKATDPKEVARLNKELDKVEANLLQAQKATLNAQQAMQGMGKQTNLVQQALKQIGPQIAAAFSIAAISAFVKKSIDLSAAFEQNVISIEQFVGSTDKAKKLLRELEQFAAKTPFEFPEIADSAKRLLAFGVGAENITDTLKRLGDIAAGTGQPLGEISLIYGQILAKGKLQGEELLQFAEKGVPLLQAVADVLGKSTGETQKLISAGKVGFKEVEKAIANMTNEGGKFFGLTEKQSESLGGRLSTLADAFNGLMRSIGDAIAPVVESIAIKLTGIFEKVTGFITDLTKQKSRLELEATTTDSWLKQDFAITRRSINNTAAEFDNQLVTAFKASQDELAKFHDWVFNNENKQIQRLTAAGSAATDQWGNLYTKPGLKTGQLWIEMFSEFIAVERKANTETQSLNTNINATGNAAQKATPIMQGMTNVISGTAKSFLDLKIALTSLNYLSNVVNDLEDIMNRLDVGSRPWMEYAEKVKKAREELQFFKDKADLLMGGIQTVTPMTPTMPGMEAAAQKTGEASGAAFKDGFSRNVNASIDESAVKLQEWMKKAMPIIQSMVSLINEIFTLQSELIQRNLEQEMAAIDKRYNKEIQAAKGNRIEIAKIDKKYREDKAKAEAAARRKEQQIAIAQALINGAIAITNIIATTPIPLWPVIIPISAATTAAQIALIASQKFAKGVIDLKGPGHETSDSIPAMLSKGESVMTARETREWKPLLQAIRRRDVIPGPMGMPVFRDDRKISVSASLNDRKIIATLQEQNAILRQVVKRNRYSATSEFSDKKRLPYG